VISFTAKYLLKGMLRLYQLFLSPLVGPSCRFYPSCSSYAAAAVEKYGALYGMRLSLWRLAKCHPWHPGGYDPLP
jgi:putative membrane protein insertion efficiency factor